MTSYRRALSTVLYLVCFICFVVGVVARFTISSGFGAGLIFIVSISFFLLAIKYDERL